MATETLLPDGLTTNTWTSGVVTDVDNGVDTPTDGSLILSTETEGAVLLFTFADIVDIVDADTVDQIDIRYRGKLAANANDGVSVDLRLSSGVIGASQVPALTNALNNYTLNDATVTTGWNEDRTVAVLNTLEVAVTTTQGGKPGATDLDLSEIEVVITYTPAAAGGTELDFERGATRGVHRGAARGVT